MSKILLGHSYFLRFDPKLWQAMQPYPPLGTLYAASVLRDLGHAVTLFDAMLATSTGEWDDLLQRDQPAYAILYEDNFNYLSKMCLLNMRQAALSMVRSAVESGCNVIVAGSDVTDHAILYLQAGADYAILGEGEETLAQLISALEAGDKRLVGEVSGISFLESGQVVRRPARPIIRDVDAIPFPAWDLVDVEKYRRIWMERHGYYSMNIVTTRGCPYHCNWCAKPIWGQRYNSRSPENVVKELKWLKDQYAPDHIWFADDIMGLKPGWWQRFAELVESEDALIPFKCLSRADLIVRSQENVTALRRAGCEVVWIGAESGSQKILDAMEKGIRIDQIREAAARLQGEGIRAAFFLQFGYPGETWDDIQATLAMVRQVRPDDIGMSVSYPLPGTRFYENVAAQLGEKQNWQDSADLEMLYQGPFSSDFYRQLHVTLHLEFRMRNGGAELRSVAARPSGWRLSHLRLAAAVLYRGLKLPWARWKLARLARPESGSLGELSHMSLDEAAAPSLQTE